MCSIKNVPSHGLLPDTLQACGAIEALTRILGGGLVQRRHPMHRTQWCPKKDSKSNSIACMILMMCKSCITNIVSLGVGDSDLVLTTV